MGSFPKAQTADTVKVKHEAPKRSLFNNRLLSLSRLSHNSRRFLCVKGKNVDSSVEIFVYILNFNPCLFFCLYLVVNDAGRASVKKKAILFFPKEATSTAFVPQTRCFHDPAAVTSV